MEPGKLVPLPSCPDPVMYTRPTLTDALQRSTTVEISHAEWERHDRRNQVYIVGLREIAMLASEIAALVDEHPPAESLRESIAGRTGIIEGLAEGIIEQMQEFKSPREIAAVTEVRL